MTTGLAGLVLAVLTVLGDAELQPHGHVCNPGDPGFHLPFCDTKLTPEVIDNARVALILLLHPGPPFPLCFFIWVPHQAQFSSCVLTMQPNLGSVRPYRHLLCVPKARASDLVARLTLDEKTHLVAVRGDSADAGVARLGIPQYDWGIEILHGAGVNCIGEHWCADTGGCGVVGTGGGVLSFTAV